MRDIMDMFDKILEECGCVDTPEPPEVPEYTVNMSANVVFDDDTTVTKSFENVEEFQKFKEDILNMSNVSSCSFNMNETYNRIQPEPQISGNVIQGYN